MSPSGAYYNEHDPFAAAWLRELIAGGHIADGEVDERDIRTVSGADLGGFTQCHFFAGIGGWSYALRLAGWGDDRPVWTGSCPCQPFSAAGAQQGVDDPRHLWPTFARLIGECRPPVVFGEQVEAAIGHGWLDLVSDDLEREGYAVGAVGLPAASVGAPHIRQRMWFVADAGQPRRQQVPRSAPCDEAEDGGARRDGSEPDGDYELAGDGQDLWLELPTGHGREPRGTVAGEWGAVGGCGGGNGLAHPQRHPRGPGRVAGQPREGAGAAQPRASVESGRRRDVGELGHSNGLRSTWVGGGGQVGTPQSGQLGDPRRSGLAQQRGQRGTSRDAVDTDPGEAVIRAGAPTGSVVLPSREQVGIPGRPWESRTTHFWSACDWLPCRDNKSRPVEPGTFPLAHGVSARVGLVCADCLQVAAEGADDEDLRELRQIALAEAERLPEEVLRSGVHGGSVHEDADERASGAVAGTALLSDASLRTVRSRQGRTTSTPSGSESDEQHAREYSGLVSCLSSCGPSGTCERCGNFSEVYRVTIMSNGRVGRLRGYGNAIVPQVAQVFIEAYLDVRRHP